MAKMKSYICIKFTNYFNLKYFPPLELTSIVIYGVYNGHIAIIEQLQTFKSNFILDLLFSF